MKRSILVVVALLSAAMVSCGDSASVIDQTTDGVDSTTSEASAVETESTILKDNLPDDLDFGGAQISVLARGNDDSYLEIDAENDGDVVNDAIHFRNLTVEERLNVDLIPVRGEGWQNYGSDISKIRACAQANDDAYQIIAGWGQNVAALALENVFFDLNDVKYLDFDQPWWNQTTTESMNIAGSLYFVTGDIGLLTSLGGSYVLFANDVIMNTYDVANLSEMVLNGTWTIDAMLTETAKVYQDLDGNSVMDDQDLYGFVIDHHIYADYFTIGVGIQQIKLNDEKIPEYTPQIEKMSALIDKITPIFGANGASVGAMLLNNGQGGGRHYEMFPEGKAMIISAELGFATTADYRNAEDSYTILPYPKLDEAQEGYYVNGANGASLWGIPTSNPNPDAAAAVMEAMACQSYNTVTPAYFETCLQTKMARNEDSIQMLQIIREGCVVDAEYLFASMFGNTNNIASSILSGNMGVASWYEANQKKIDNALEKTIEAFTGLQS